MKRTISFVLIIVILFLTVCFTTIKPISIYASQAPTRVINLVYDDSGSMIQNNKGDKVDTWCQAKYAMEVFASMLGDNDTMNIYVMSDFEYGTSGAPKLILYGVEGASVNVDKVHGMITAAGNTPFNAVRKAEMDLENAIADEKWLVVLTDGEFEDGAMKQSEIDQFFSEKPADINVMYLGMGSDAGVITANEGNHIYYSKAQSNSEILRKLSEISTQIFNSNRLDVNTSSKIVGFDIPMSELVVFAQGANVSIEGIQSAAGVVIESTSNPVTVKYSEKPATNYSDFIVNRNLMGCIATFRGDFDAGDYIINVSGAETIEVFYKPNVEIAAFLKDAEGKEVTDLGNLEAGDYTIDFSLVRPGTKELLRDSKLLGKVEFEALVTNNGVTHEQIYKSGDRITIEEGPLEIDAIGKYLDYNTVETHLDYSIFRNKGIDFSIHNNPNYIVNKNGFADIPPLQIKASIDGRDFTQEEWNVMGIPSIQLTEKKEYALGEFRIEKSDEVGVYNVYPSIPDNKPTLTTYSDASIEVSYEGKSGSETWSGNNNVTMNISDERSWLQRNIIKVIKFTILGILFLILLGYMPFIKHYLPKSLKKKPHINCVPEELGLMPKTGKGKFEKILSSTIIPYVPQRGTITYVPQGVTGAPKLKVKGAKGGRMSITNARDFGNKEYITFDGEKMDKEVKEYNTSAGVMVVVRKTGWKYTCTLNQSID